LTQFAVNPEDYNVDAQFQRDGKRRVENTPAPFDLAAAGKFGRLGEGKLTAM